MKFTWKKVEKLSSPIVVRPGDTIQVSYAKQWVDSTGRIARTETEYLQKETINETMLVDQTCLFGFKNCKEFGEFEEGIGGIFGKSKE